METSCKDEHCLELVCSAWVWYYEFEHSCHFAIHFGQLC